MLHLKVWIIICECSVYPHNNLQSDHTSSIPAILFTASFFRELWSFLSSAVAVLCTTFFFLRAVPLPPIRTWAWSLANFSWFMLLVNLKQGGSSNTSTRQEQDGSSLYFKKFPLTNSNLLLEEQRKKGLTSLSPVPLQNPSQKQLGERGWKLTYRKEL